MLDYSEYEDYDEIQKELKHLDWQKSDSSTEFLDHQIEDELLMDYLEWTTSQIMSASTPSERTFYIGLRDAVSEDQSAIFSDFELARRNANDIGGAQRRLRFARMYIRSESR